MRNPTAEPENFSSAGEVKASRIRVYTVIFTVIILSLSGLYLRFEWNRYKGIASSEAIMLAESLESVLHPEHIAGLTGDEQDLEKPEYIMTKTSLQRLAGTTNPIRFAYLMAEREGRIIIPQTCQEGNSSGSPWPGPLSRIQG
jgi:hypothetical protein